MKRLRKLAIVSIMTLLCLTGVSVRAAVSVTDFTGDVENGSARSSAIVTNTGTEVASPILVIVRYEDGVMTGVDFDYHDSELQSGDSVELAVNMPGTPVTNLTRITAFVLESRQYAKPIMNGVLEIERQGSNKTGIQAIRFTDIETEETVIDEVNKTVQMYLPLYDEEGEAIDTENLSLCVNVDETAEQVRVGDTLLSGDGTEKVGEISLNDKMLTVTSEDGTQDDYQLIIWRTLSENMEEGGRLSGYSMGKSGAAGTYVGDFAVTGTKTSAIFVPGMNSAGVGDKSYFAGIGLGVQPISSALPAPNASAFPVGDSGANGNALLLRKDTHTSGIGATGCPLMYIYGNKMEGFAQAVHYEIEFDMAVGLNVNGPVRQSQVAGLDIRTSNGTYRISNTGGSNVASAKFTAGDDQNHVGSSGLSADQWRHFKVMVEQQSNGSFRFTTWVDDTEIPAVDNMVNMGQPSVLLFEGSALRASELWIDNISIRYH